MRLVFMGTPEFAVFPLEQLLFNQYQVVAVYTQPDRMAGRGRSLASSPVKKAALGWGLPVVQPVNFKQTEVVAQLADFRPDVIVLVAYGQILPPSVLSLPGYGCINLHPSLLPRFRGASPVASAILAGNEFTGVTTMLMDRGLDTGLILSRVQIAISAWDTTASLMAKLSRVGAQLLLEVLPRWLRGELIPQAQNEAEATYSKIFSKEDGEIDWHLPAGDIWRRVRAFHPWPGCYTRWQGRLLKIMEAVPLASGENLGVGQVISLDKAGVGFGINTGDGVLGVLKVQWAGKQVMSAAEFLRGQRQCIGAILPSH